MHGQRGVSLMEALVVVSLIGLAVAVLFAIAAVVLRLPRALVIVATSAWLAFFRKRPSPAAA